MDIFIQRNKENIKRTLKALSKFGYDVTDISEEDMQQKKILIRQYIFETDIHPFVAGISFDQVWKNKVRSKIGSTEAYFASLDDLIKMKSVAGRAKDLEDLKVLEKLKQKLRKN